MVDVVEMSNHSRTDGWELRSNKFTQYIHPGISTANEHPF